MVTVLKISVHHLENISLWVFLYAYHHERFIGVSVRGGLPRVSREFQTACAWIGITSAVTELLVQPFVVIFHLSSVLTEHS